MKFVLYSDRKDLKMTYSDICLDTVDLRARSDKLHCNVLKFWPEVYGPLRRMICVEFPALDSVMCPSEQPCTTILSTKSMVYPT